MLVLMADSETSSAYPPIAQRIPAERTFHGDTFNDPYEWLRAKEDPAVINHLTQENAYTDFSLESLSGLREKIFQEIKERTQETDLSVPVRKGDWWYISRSEAGKQYGIHSRLPVTDPTSWTPPSIDAESTELLPGEQVVFDSNVAAEGHDFFSLGTYHVSEDGSLLLYGVDTQGDERYTLRIRDLTTGEDLPDEITETASGALFSPDSSYVFYPTVDDAWRPDRIWRHRVGTDRSEDQLVFHEPDEHYWVGVGLTKSKKFLEIYAGSKITTEILLTDATNPTGDFTVFWPREEGVEYGVEHAVINGHDSFIVLHNKNGLNFSADIVSADALSTGIPRQLSAFIEHRNDIRLEDVDVFKNFLVISYRRDALTRVAFLNFSPDNQNLTGYQLLTSLGPATELVFEEPLFTVGAGGNPEWAQPTFRIGYGSMVTPSTVLDINVSSGERTVLKQQTVLGDYQPQDYVQRREWATAPDGTKVPISLVYRADKVTPGTPAPLVLYGYGSYEASIDPYFSISRLSLLDRGVVYAVAHIRGGGELGRQWYEDGKELKKRNTFTDFIACAEHLIDTGWTASDRLVAEGHSAGGLLMGAVVNLAPSLFTGVLAGVPFVDALTSILDPSLPLTVIEWDEWGDPLHNADVYEYMKSYSPYENVRKLPEGTSYPQILAVTSLNDTRVLYVEPAKWVARLREVGAPVLLKTEMSAGHGGVSGRYEKWKETAYEYAWMLQVLNRSE